jgi:arylformamidase
MASEAQGLSISPVNGASLMMTRNRGSTMERVFSKEFIEREYNNRARVPDHGDYFARWERDSEFVRATLLAKLDLAYGPDPRHRIDLFPAGPKSRGTLVFIHGGWWRSLDKSVFSWLAAAWNAAGIHVAIPNYRLTPAVRIDDIVDDAIAATNWLFAHGPRHDIAMDRVVLAGHSAGGHLAAALFAAPPARLQFDPARIVGGVPISGLFDFEPLRQFSFNADFRLDAAAVQRLDLGDKPRTLAAPLVVAAGADESSEFQRQSRLLAEAWSPQVRSLLLLPGVNHFSIVDTFAERGQPLHEATLALF